MENDGVQLKKTEDADELLQKIEEAGKEMFAACISWDSFNRSIMFPPSPTSPFIDKFPSENLRKAEQSAAKQQAGYEGEVKVSRVLESLREGRIVLHSLKYTHQQYKLFVDHECKRRDQEEEGETDFVVVHDGFIAVVEVKTLEESKKNLKTVFERNYKKSKQQRETTCRLIEGICRKVGLGKPEIRQFTIFTNITRETAEKISKYSSLEEKEKQDILFEDDLVLGEHKTQNVEECFDTCCKRGYGIRAGESDEQSNKTLEDKVLWILLGLWCVDNENKFNTEKCDLGKTIYHIDGLIKDALITNKPEGPTSSKIKGSPKVFKDLGIKCLTVEQKKLFYDKKPRLLINGPAGSGKTLLIMGKVIQLVKESETPIIILVSNNLIAEEYKRNLQKIGISSCFVNYGGNFEKDNSIKWQNKLSVSIVFFSDYYFNANASPERGVEERLCGLKDVFQTESHIFIDDFHDFSFAVVMLSYSFLNYKYNLSFATLARSFQLNDEIENIWQFVLSQICLPSHKLLWVCFDSLQSPVNAFNHQLGALEDWKSKITVHELSANLRNSYEIAFFLDFIRNERLANINKRIAIFNALQNKKYKAADGTSYRDSLSYIPFDVKQDIGHYIHGPTPRICLVDVHGRKKNTVAGYLADFLTNELSKLVGCSSVAIIHDDYGQRSKDFNGHNYVGLEDVCQQSKEQIDRDFLACGMGLQVHHFDEIASLEWPAVIGIIEVDDRDRIPLEHLDDFFTFFCNYDPVLFETFNFSKDRIDAFLSKIYQIASRARVYCTLILVSNFKKPISTFIRNPSKIDDEERPPEFGFDSDIDFPFSTIGISTKEYKSVKLTNQYYYFIINKALQKDEIKDQLIEGLKNCGFDPENFKKPINLPNEEISKIIRNFNGIKPWIGEFLDRMSPFVIINFHSHACIDKEMIEICDKKDIDYPSQLEVALSKAMFIFSKGDSDNETAQKTEQEKEVKTDEGEDEKVEADENKTDEGEDEKVEAEENRTDENKTDEGEDEKVESGYKTKRCLRLDYEAMTPELKFFMWSIQIEMERHLKKISFIDYKPLKSD